MIEIDYLVRFIKSVYDDDLFGLSAQTAFYLILSIFPLALFIVSMLQRVSVTDNLLFLEPFLPESVLKLLENTITSIPIGKDLKIISAIAMIWAASNSIYALMKGVHKAYTNERLKFTVKTRAVAIIFTVVFSIAIIISLSMLVLWESISQGIVFYFGFSTIFINFFRHIIAIAAIFLFILALYYFTPGYKIRLKFMLVGSISSAVGWFFSSQVFEFYMHTFNQYSTLYGSIGTFLGLGLWLYIISFIVLLGAEINALFIK